MKSLRFSPMDMGDELEFALRAVLGVLSANPGLTGICDPTDFSVIREVVACKFFIRHHEIKGRKLTVLLPIAEQWVQTHDVGYRPSLAAFIVAAAWCGYKIVFESADCTFVRTRRCL